MLPVLEAKEDETTSRGSDSATQSLDESAELEALRAELAASCREAEMSCCKATEQRALDKVEQDTNLAALQVLSKSALEANMKLRT